MNNLVMGCLRRAVLVFILTIGGGILISASLSQDSVRITGLLSVEGRVKIGDGGTTDVAGSIRWNTETADFEGFNGTEWLSLTATGAGPNYDLSITGPGTVCHLDHSLADDGAAGDIFGQAVAISGDYTIIGARGDDDNGSNSGSAYIFHRNGSTWTEQAKLLPSDGAANDFFGGEVALSDDYAVVAAHLDDDNANNSGSAYIFQRSDTTWTELTKLHASDATSDDAFGQEVAIDGDRVLVTAWNPFDLTATGQGYVFLRDGDDWVEEDIITNPNAPLFVAPGFGISGTIEDDLLIVTAHLTYDTVIFGMQIEISPALYVYRRTESAWNHLITLTGSNPSTDDGFGRHVDMSGDFVIAPAFRGDPEHTCNGISMTDAGIVHIFKNSNEVWYEHLAISDPIGTNNDQIGTRAGVSGNHIVIGADQVDPNSNSNQGKVIFARIE